MNETLKTLYDSFYMPLALTEEKQEIKTCHQQLIEKLDKPERKLVLRIIDAKDFLYKSKERAGVRHQQLNTKEQTVI